MRTIVAPRALARLLAVAGLFGAVATSPATGQVTCRTTNCALGGNPPAACRDRAAPRTLRSVTMSGDGFINPFAFTPSEPRIEPGDCIRWVATTVFHNSSDTTCIDDPGCSAAPAMACLWDTGNVAANDPDPAAICHYDAANWPGGTSDPYYCRIHASPTTGTMRGTLRVTTAIVLSMAKSGNDVRLTWTGGGLAGSEIFNVVRSTDDPLFPAASTSTFLPNAGARAHDDAGELLNDETRYYLVVNRN